MVILLSYGCRNGAKFNILKFYSYSTFIHSYSTFVFLFSINICSKFNIYICIQQFYLFTKLLSIQKLFIYSTSFYSFKIYCASLLRMEVTYFLQQMNRGSKEAQAIIRTFKRYRLFLRWVQRGKAPPIRTFKTLPDYSPTMSHWFFANIFRELQTREKCKEVLYTIRKINGVINPPMGKGGSCFSPVCGKLLFQTNF